MLATLAAIAALLWPKPDLPVIHTASVVEAIQVAANHAVEHGWIVAPVSYTGSMRPLLNGGEWVLLEPYHGQDLREGMVIVFDRGDVPRVLHMIARVRGDTVYMSGINNRYSDGWFPKSAVAYIAREAVGW